MRVTLNPTLPIYQSKIRSSIKTSTKNATSLVQNSQFPGYSHVDANFKRYNLNKISFGSAATEKLLKEIGLFKVSPVNVFEKLNENIAGYQIAKRKIEKVFVMPLLKSRFDQMDKVPSCIVLHGSAGTGKTALTKTLKEATNDFAQFIDISSSINSINFRSRLDEILKEAKIRYAETQKRTVLVIDSAERILSINKRDVPALGMKLDEYDMQTLNYYDSDNNSYNISYFKTLLDEVSKTPEKGDQKTSYKAATTFLLQTNYPHLIETSIIHKESKIPKIAMNVASDFDLEAVLKFHLEKMRNIAEHIKEFKNNPEAIEKFTEISDKGKENLRKMIDDGTINKLRIDVDSIPYSRLVKSLNPSEEKGAYSNFQLKTIVQDSLIDYLEKNPVEDKFSDSFLKALINNKRDISPEKYQKYKTIDMMFDDGSEPDPLVELLYEKEMGDLSKDEEFLLTYHIANFKEELNSLNKKAELIVLKETEQTRKKELEEFLQIISKNE